MQRDAQDQNHEPIPPSLGRPTARRASKLDAFESQIRQLLERYPKITNVRLYEEIKASGYSGRYSILAERMRQLRDRPMKPLTVRFETGPGVQAQMDWSTYEIEFTQEGRRKVQLFSYILGYSRRQYIHFTLRQDFETTIRQHIEAFKHLGGVATTCLYDNMKVVVTRWEDDSPIYNTRFLAFATHYGYRPWACQVRRPQTKGKVERPFYYVETNLLNGRQFRSLQHLNEHLPPRDHEAQMQSLRERYTALGEIAAEFFEGLLTRTRYSKHHAQKVLTLLNVYPKSDVVAAIKRAVTYRAFGYSILERILAHQSTPKPSWQQLSVSEQEAIAKLTNSKPIPPRHSQEYQDLLYGKKETVPETNPDAPFENQPHESQEDDEDPRSQDPRSQEPRSSSDDSDEHGNAEDQNGTGGA